MPILPDIKSYDALVVGLGPAGATAAYDLSRAGLSVLAIDKHTHPRYKVCGGGLSVRIEQLLDPGFKSVVEETIFGFQFLYRGEKSITIESPSPIAYMVMRDRFDHHLVQQARYVGTEIHQGEQSQSFRHLPDGVEMTTDRGCYHAKVLIGADGGPPIDGFLKRLRYVATLLRFGQQKSAERAWKKNSTKGNFLIH